MQSNLLLAGLDHKREPESHPVASSIQISDSKNEKLMSCINVTLDKQMKPSPLGCKTQKKGN
jgi:hypothetical protein